MSAARGPGNRPPLGGSLLGISQRMPPTNIQAEQALLGAILANAKAYHAVADFLAPHHFADPVHAAIYEAAGRRISAGGIADAITLMAHFANSGILDEAGGTKYLAELLSAMVGIIHAPEYGRAIVDAWARRELIGAGEDLVNGAFDGSSDLGQLLDAVGRAIGAASGLPSGTTPLISMDMALDAALTAAEQAANGNGPQGLMTGFAGLDRAYMGLMPGDLNILGARPAMGKSSLGFQIAINAGIASRDAKIASGANMGVVYVQSLEMQALNLGRRALAAFSEVPSTKIRTGDIRFVRSQLKYARAELDSLPLYIDETPALNIRQITARARELHRRHGKLALIMVDHLHIVGFDDDSAKRGYGATQEVGMVSRGLKRLAKELHCPVLALAQLSRGVEAREDKRPTMNDLRQSGEIEQDADTIAFVYRPEYYLGHPPEMKPGEKRQEHAARLLAWDEQKDRVRGKAEVIMAKLRENEPRTVHMRWNGETTSFSERQDAHRDQDDAGY